MANTMSQRRSFTRNGEADMKEALVAAARPAGTDAAEARIRREDTTRRVPFTVDDLTVSNFFRTEFGWRRIAKVNRKSVGVETGYSWMDLVPLVQVLEVRAIAAS